MGIPFHGLVPIQMVGATEKTDNFVQDLILKAYKGHPRKIKKAFAEYLKLRHMEHILVNAIEEDWEIFEWKRAHEEGMLCDYDYEVFEGAKKVKHLPSEYSKYIGMSKRSKK